MAYNLSERFRCDLKNSDPGAYQFPNPPAVKPNKVPFLSTAPRRTDTTIHTLRTHQIYYRNVLPNVPNITAFMSEVPRFKNQGKHDFESKDLVCDCEDNESGDKDQGVCQATVKRRLFKGLTNAAYGKKKETPKRDVPFYDARVHESTAFYHGCKWSKWAGKRRIQVEEDSPGPADYNIKQEPSASEICNQNFRFYRRKISKQPRYLDIIERRNILENQPGPASYTPIHPQRKDFHYTTTTNKGINLKLKPNTGPGPADHFIRRDFDIRDYDNITCHVKLPPRAPFGYNAVRFKPCTEEEGASPASYSINLHFKHCSDKPCNVPFGSSSKRFAETPFEDSDDEGLDDEAKEVHHKGTCVCGKSTWPFKSKTIRLKSLKTYEPKPDPMKPTEDIKITRPLTLQYMAPFHSSEGRFRNWFNWIRVYGTDPTPGPAYYCLERPKCVPAVHCGPLIRVARFKSATSQIPAPNEYKITGIEDILKTHNLKLKTNIENCDKFRRKRRDLPAQLTPLQQEIKLLNECIKILDADDVFAKHMEVENPIFREKKKKKIDYVASYESRKLKSQKKRL